MTKDWQLGLIVQARSGSGITPGVTDEQLAAGRHGASDHRSGRRSVHRRPTSAPWVVNNGVQSLTWFNPAAFGPNSPGVWGNTPKSYLTGPGFWNADAAFSRNINMAKAHRVEIRVEAFNLFNHANWGNPNVTQGSTSSDQRQRDQHRRRPAHHAVRLEVRVLADALLLTGDRARHHAPCPVLYVDRRVRVAVRSADRIVVRGTAGGPKFGPPYVTAFPRFPLQGFRNGSS